MHRLLLFFLGISILMGAGGCAPLCRPEILSQEAKRTIYRHVARDIEARLRAGKEYWQQGEYFKALQCYRQASFYESGRADIKAAIAALTSKIASESANYYQRGQQLLERDRQKALIAFNRALQINPEHQAAREAHARLLQEPENVALLARLEAELARMQEAYTAGPKELMLLDEKIKALLAYDYRNRTALAAKEVVEQDRRHLVGERLRAGDAFSAAGKTEEAERLYLEAKALAPGNAAVSARLRQLRRQQEFAQMLVRARDRLRANDWRKAVEWAAEALALAPANQEAVAIVGQALEHRPEVSAAPPSLAEMREYATALASLTELFAVDPGKESATLLDLARQRLAEEIARMAEVGQRLYEAKELDRALAVFNDILEIDAENDMAQIFVRKIRNRLETIEGLR